MASADFTFRLGLDGTKVEHGVDRLQRHFDSFGRRLAGLFTVGAAVGVVRKIVEMADSLDDLSKRTGVSIETLQKWQFVLGQTGGSLDTLTRAFKFFQLAQAEAMGGASTPAGKVFAKYGVSAGQSSESAFTAMIGALGKAPNNANTLKDAKELFGKEPYQVLQMAREGFTRMAESAESLANVIDTKTVKALADFNDQLAALKGQMLKEMAPAVGLLARAFLEVRASVAAWRAYMGAKGSGSIAQVLTQGFLTLNPIGLLNPKLAALADGKMNTGDADAAAMAAYMKVIDSAKQAAGGQSGGGEAALPDAAGGRTKSGKETQADSLARIGLFRGALPDMHRQRFFADVRRSLNSIERQLQGIQIEFSRDE